MGISELFTSAVANGATAESVAASFGLEVRLVADFRQELALVGDTLFVRAGSPREVTERTWAGLILAACARRNTTIGPQARIDLLQQLVAFRPHKTSGVYPAKTGT